MKINAKGVIFGISYEVECGVNNGIVYFMGDEDVKKEFYDLIDQVKLFAGTFQPEANSEINVLNVIENHLFDDLVSIDIFDFTESMPSEKDVVY